MANVDDNRERRDRVRIDWDGARRVEESTPISPDDFSARVRGGDAPLILRGQVAGWPLVDAGKAGSEAFCSTLLRHANERPVRYFEAQHETRGRFFYTDDLLDFNFERKEAALPAFLERLRALESAERAPHLYAGAIPLPEHAPGLAATHDHGLLTDGTEQLVSLWIGNRSRTAAHHDLPQNLACVLCGRRRFILLPVAQLPNLYIGPLDRTPAGQAISLVDFLDPDFEAHPRFREAMDHALVADLAPGDALYVPSLWYHHVECPDPFGAMMNFWWRDAPAYMFTPLITLMHSLLSLRELPPNERAAWRTVFDHYVFQVNGDPMAHIPEQARGIFGDMTPDKVRRLKHYLGKALG
jgi:hypothetical protein